MKALKGDLNYPAVELLKVAMHVWVSPSNKLTLDTPVDVFFAVSQEVDHEGGEWSQVYATIVGGGWTLDGGTNLHPNYGKQFVKNPRWEGWDEIAGKTRVAVLGDALIVQAVKEHTGYEPPKVTMITYQPPSWEATFKLDLENLPDPEDLLAHLGEFGFVGVYVRVLLAFMTVSDTVTVMSLQGRELPGVNRREEHFENWVNRAEDYLPAWFEEYRKLSEKWANQLAPTKVETPVYDRIKAHLDKSRAFYVGEVAKIDKFSPESSPFIARIELIDDLIGEFGEMFDLGTKVPTHTRLEQVIGILEDVLTRDESTPVGADLALVGEALKRLQLLVPDADDDDGPPFDVE